MAKTQLTCLRCSGVLEEGFLGAQTSQFGSIEPSAWIEGVPEPSLFTGTKTTGRRRYPVQCFRCAGCGYLELFAGVDAAEAASGIECLACGAHIPGVATACPACGWTWEEARDEQRGGE